MELSARPVPVVAEADIVVVGGGPGGFAAALQAARMGCSVVMIERFDMPGGVHTSGLQGAANEGVGGIHTELMQRFDAKGYIFVATDKDLPGWAGNPLSHYERNHKPGASFKRASFNPEGAGCEMVQMLDEAGVTAMYQTSLVDVVVEDGAGDARIVAVIVQNAGGTQAIRGRIFIDGTGTAELAARAGAPYVSGGGGQPEGADWDGVKRPIPGGLLWTMTGVQYEKLIRYQQTSNDPTLTQLIAEASAAGDIPKGLYRPRMEGGPTVYGEAYIGHPTLDMSPINAPGTFIIWQNVPYEWALRMDESAADESRARRELRAFIDAEARFLKKYVPGFEAAELTDIGRFVGIRDGRHPVGEHVFTIEDAREGRSFRDAVTKPMTKTFFWDGYRKHTFEVPYRSFLPKKVGNLLLTGASMSFSYETIFMVMRNFPWCTQTGEIAGFAAARAIQQGVGPKDFEWKEPYF
jgi:hypothetical protein